VIWSAGVKPNRVPVNPEIARAPNGAIKVAADCSVPQQPGVWAIGDCAQIPNPAGGYYAPTAQHALREGPLVAGNICARLKNEPTRPFMFKQLGMMASLGNREALADVRGHLIRGFPAWLMWRTYYLVRLPGLDRKSRVALDWTLALVFPRDISQLRLMEPPGGR